MKRLIPIVVFLAIVGFISQAEAQTSGDCGMSVTVTAQRSVEVTDEPLTFGSVAPGSKTVNTDASGCTVTNSGTKWNAYELQITAKPTAWSVAEGATDPGNEEFRLLALFTSDTSLETADFLTADDIVKETAATLATTETVYAIDAEGPSVKGADCSAGAVRKLWFRFDAPTTTDLSDQQWITVTITATGA